MRSALTGALAFAVTVIACQTDQGKPHGEALPGDGIRQRPKVDDDPPLREQPTDPGGEPPGSTSFWDGLARSAAMATSPYGHKVAISCHNCYAATIAATSSKIATAITDGADLVELDVRQHSDGVTYVMHDEVAPPAGTPTLAQVLAIPALRDADRPLFIEFKETTPDEAFIRGVLDALMKNGYGVATRPVFLRAFGTTNDNLRLSAQLLATPAYATLAPHVRLSVLLRRGDGADVTALRGLILATKTQGFHMVELEYRTPNIFGGLAYAKSLGLATGLYTIPNALGEMVVAGMRDDVDELTVDYPIVKTRKVVADEESLVYFNAAEQAATGATFSWQKGSATPAYTSPLNTAAAPTGVTGGLEDAFFGTALELASAEGRHAVLYDADNAATTGYFVATAVKFDSLAMAEGQTKVLVGKADAGGFTLELYRAAGSSAVLRFGVHVNGSYVYATSPVSSLDTTASFFVSGAYDGAGAVQLMIDNSDVGSTASANVTGGVTQNDSAILVGADPQTDSAPRFFFDGKIQMLSVQRWAER